MEPTKSPDHPRANTTTLLAQIGTDTTTHSHIETQTHIYADSHKHTHTSTHTAPRFVATSDLEERRRRGQAGRATALPVI